MLDKRSKIAVERGDNQSRPYYSLGENQASNMMQDGIIYFASPRHAWCQTQSWLSRRSRSTFTWRQNFPSSTSFLWSAGKRALIFRLRIYTYTRKEIFLTLYLRSKSSVYIGVEMVSKPHRNIYAKCAERMTNCLCLPKGSIPIWRSRDLAASQLSPDSPMPFKLNLR